MKTPIQNLPHFARLIALLLLSILNLPLSTFAQDTLITYQGRLNDNGNPANGLYDLRFSLYDNSSGGLPVGNNVSQTAPVTNGLFTSSINFGASFAGANRWLQLEVRTNGSGAGYTVLDPRQRVTAAPYSIYALAAATAATAGSASNVVSGSVVSSVNTLKDNVILQAGSNVTISPSGNTLTIASAGVGGSGIWSVLNNNAYYNAGNVGIGTTTPSAYGHGGTAKILEVNNSGTVANSQAHLMLFTGVNSLLDSAMGTVTWAQPGGMAAYIGAQTRSTTPNAPAAMLSFGTRKIGDGAASPKMVITEEGNVGIGTTAPTAGYRLEVTGATQLRPGNGTVQFGSPNAELGMSITPTVGNRADLRFDGSVLKLVATAGQAPPSAANGIAITTAGDVGIGTTAPLAKLHVEGNAAQPRDKGGFVKAMAYIDPFLPADQYVVRSYNSQGATITVTRVAPGSYWIDFGFKVDDRFISVTPAITGVSMSATPRPGGFNNQIGVGSALSDDPSTRADTPFFIFVY